MNFSVSELYEYALQPEHLTSINPHVTATTIADSGALSVSSGLKTGRTPKDKRVVLDDTTKDVCINGLIAELIFIYRVFGGAVSIFPFLQRDSLETEKEQSTS